MKPKVFSIEEANSLLKDIRHLVSCLRQKRHDMVKMHEQLLTLELMEEESENVPKLGNGPEYLRWSSALENLVVSFEGDIKRIAGFGCLLRDIDEGVVDFYHVKGESLVFLNWRLGEDEIQFWRELDSGFFDRLPLSELVK